MICDFCYASDRFKILYKDWIALIYILTSVCRYSHERSELHVALPRTVADILADLHHLLLMHSTDLLKPLRLIFNTQ